MAAISCPCQGPISSMSRSPPKASRRRTAARRSCCRRCSPPYRSQTEIFGRAPSLDWSADRELLISAITHFALGVAAYTMAARSPRVDAEGSQDLGPRRSPEFHVKPLTWGETSRGDARQVGCPLGLEQRSIMGSEGGSD